MLDKKKLDLFYTAQIYFELQSCLACIQVGYNETKAPQISVFSRIPSSFFQ